MFKVEKKPKTPNMIWDADNNRPLCKFVNGVFETGDEALAEKLEEIGHTVTGEADAKPLEKMTVDELKSYAEEYSIDLGKASNKADILKAIQEAE